MNSPEKIVMVKHQIVAAVEGKQGCKAMELLADPSLKEAILHIGERFPFLIDELVQEGRLVEIEYTLPLMDGRVKSFLLPAGSEVRLLASKTSANEDGGST